MADSGTPNASEASPLLPTRDPSSALPRPSNLFSPSRSRGPTFLVLLFLAIASPFLLNSLYQNRISPTIHPGIAAAGPVHLPVPHVPLSFLALGDWGREGKHGQKHVAQAMADTVTNTIVEKGYNPHFIISTGDNFYSNGVSSIDDRQFSTSYRDVYNHLILSNIPWYSVLGNHDHHGNVEAQVAFTSHEARWNMPATYFARKFSDNLIAIFLDTTPFIEGNDGVDARDKNRQDPYQQVRWLKRQLADSPSSAYFLIVAHHNMYTMSTNGHLGSKELRDLVEPVLMPYKSRTLAYISGHEHALMHMQPHPRVDRDDASAPYTAVVDHFLSGAGSKLDEIVQPSADEADHWQECCGVLRATNDTSVARTVWGKEVHGFFVFRFDGQRFTASAVNNHGDVVYEYEKSVA